MPSSKSNAAFFSYIPMVPASPLPKDFSETSSDVLYPADLANIRAGMHQASVALDTIEALNLALSKARETHESFLLRHRPYLCYARALPEEVWREVFLWFSFSSDSHIPVVSPNSTLLLTHVCRDWRSITIRTRELWSRIGFHVNKPNVTSGSVHLLNLFLTRSAFHALSISFHITQISWTAHDKASQENITMALQALIMHSHRWRNLSLVLPFTILKSSVFPISVPRLQEATISAQESLTGSQTDNWHPVFFDLAPELRHLTLQNFNTSPQGFKSIFPLEELRSIHLKGTVTNQYRFGQSEVLTVLEECPKLNTAFMTFNRWNDNPSPPDHVIHDSMEILSIQSLNIAFFEHISMPQLKELNVWQICREQADILAAFVTRSPVLQKIVVSSSCNCQFLSQLASLASPSSLVDLEISRRVGETEELIELVKEMAARMMDGRPFLPQLRCLTICLTSPQPNHNPLKALELHAALLALMCCSCDHPTLWNGRKIMLEMQKDNTDEIVLEAFRSLGEMGLEGVEVKII